MHIAVDQGDFDSIQAITEAAPDLVLRDNMFRVTPLAWARTLHHKAQTSSDKMMHPFGDQEAMGSYQRIIAYFEGIIKERERRIADSRV